MEHTLDISRLRITTTELAGPEIQKLRSTGVMLGVVGAILSGIGLATSHGTFMQSYLIGFVFWLGPTLGSLALLMIHLVTGGGWGFVLRRQLETSIKLFPLMGLLAIPLLLFGLQGGSLWGAWVAPAIKNDPFIVGKQAWLNVPFFTGRT